MVALRSEQLQEVESNWETCSTVQVSSVVASRSNHEIVVSAQYRIDISTYLDPSRHRNAPQVVEEMLFEVVPVFERGV